MFQLAYVKFVIQAELFYTVALGSIVWAACGSPYLDNSGTAGRWAVATAVVAADTGRADALFHAADLARIPVTS